MFKSYNISNKSFEILSSSKKSSISPLFVSVIVLAFSINFIFPLNTLISSFGQLEFCSKAFNTSSRISFLAHVLNPISKMVSKKDDLNLLSLTSSPTDSI